MNTLKILPYLEKKKKIATCLRSNQFLKFIRLDAGLEFLTECSAHQIETEKSELYGFPDPEKSKEFHEMWGSL